ncbi:MAG: flagellar brake domain-containing protein [Gammaproteobacteria bacterium]|nr:flagellar brake domain-containing protein [Gammaproteobacteria bacterium]
MYVTKIETGSQKRAAIVTTFNNLRPGALIGIEFNSELSLRIKGKLIGFDEGNYLIVSLSKSTLRDYADIIQEGVGCIVRTIVEGDAGQCVAFRSNVELISVRPKGLVFISYPRAIETSNLRKESRQTTQIPVTFVHRDQAISSALFDNKTAITGYIKDVSSGGCRIMANWDDSNPDINKVPVYLNVTVSNGSHIVLKASIRNQNRITPATVSIGLSFVEDDNLQQFLKECIL